MEARYADLTLPLTPWGRDAHCWRKGDRKAIPAPSWARQSRSVNWWMQQPRRGQPYDAVAQEKPKTNADDRGWGSLRGIDSSKPVPFVEDTGRAAMNNEISHLTASAAALLAEQPGLRRPKSRAFC
ncbi:hypothetical protein [Rhizobium tibeticum]|uniref:hypothetical protein n=1 Tax=Rhizobium tibeticum TaxID=501024 RepID=UPI001FCD0E27|nr:hypothetical protein [Rhizobium tibeticum]